ncbi:Ethylmalonic encephalopathy 1 [Quaeritorhiza haematococci]|nr:Ethylmalonic encephalopathy 1 [Quaeritorhiza haematococci]
MPNSRIPNLVFRQLFDSESSTHSYILGDSVKKECILIDPVYEQVDRDLSIIYELGLNLKFAVNTHCHADHVTGSAAIKKKLEGVKSIISEASGAHADVHLKPNDEITFGEFSLVALPTPGHTNGCMCFYLEPAGFVFTGDTLLVRGCGRTDFQEGSASTLYDSVHSKLFTLPDETLVFPGHDYKGRTVSSIGEEKKFNLRLTKSKGEFIKIMDNLGLAYPKKIDVAVPANLRCGIDYEPAK